MEEDFGGGQQQTDTDIPHPILTVDARGLFCPIPVYKERQAILEVKPKEVIELLADDPASEEDIRRWAERTGNILLAVEKSDETFRFFIQKAG